MQNITVITYADYEDDKKTMTGNDLAFFNAMAYTTTLNDTEQIIASLKGIVPALFNDLAEDKGATGKAYNLSNIDR